MIGLPLAGLAAALMVGLAVLWVGMIARVELGERRWILHALAATAMGLAGASISQSPGVLGGALAGLTLLVGVVYWVMLAFAGQSKQRPAVAVGSPILDFSALDANAEPFQLASLRGRPILLKFFRGHW